MNETNWLRYERPTDRLQEALSVGALDAAIGRFMGLEVLGEVICEVSPDCGSLQVPDRIFNQATDKHIPRPIYLRQCSCAHREPSDVEFFGHIWLCLDVVPKYSQSIEAAMQVVKKMRAQGWSFACTLYEGKLPYASFCKGTVKSSRNAEADLLPEAICLAALKALESK